jgi:hypothetical protein
MEAATMDEDDRLIGQGGHDPVYVREVPGHKPIRMSCHCAGRELDWDRGERLAEFVLAHADRFRGERPELGASWFEVDGKRVDRPTQERAARKKPR